MSKKSRHVRVANFGRAAGAFARTVRERAEQKAETTKKPPAPVDAQPVKENPFDRIRRKLEADRAQTTNHQS